MSPPNPSCRFRISCFRFPIFHSPRYCLRPRDDGAREGAFTIHHSPFTIGLMQIVPVEVRRLPEAAALRITWHDQHVSEYPYDYLRGWCPCAGCQGHGNELRFVPVNNSMLTKVAVVGNYALSLGWADGHDTGIYTYRHLRQLCPCPACRGHDR